MGDSKKFWRESIGAVSPPRPARARPAASAGPDPAPDASPAARVQHEVTGAVPLDPPTAARRPAVAVGTVEAETPARPARARSAALESLDIVLASLPIGSIAFSREVATRLWPEPQPAEVRDLARLLEGRHDLPDLAAREALTRTVAVRQRWNRLHRQAADLPLDPRAFTARAEDWSRLAAVAEEIVAALQPVPDGPGADAVKAALVLLPAPAELAAEAELARTCAALLDTVHGAAAGAAHQAPPPVDDAVSLLGAAREGKPRPNDPLFLEIWAAGSIARRDLPQGDKAALEHDLRIVTLVEARTERAITRAAATAGRDREGARRLLAWRRYLAEMHERLNTRLAPPAPKKPPRPAEPAPASAAPAARDAGGIGTPETPDRAASPEPGLFARATSRLRGLLRR